MPAVAETVPSVVGRERELAALQAFVERTDAPGAFVLEGEAGIGKTTLWREGVVLGDARGWRVLSCAPAQAESQLSFGAIADLLDTVVDEILPRLPDPQRRALAVALLLAEGAGDPPDERAIASALLAAFAQLADRAPVLVAIDDVQWIDEPSRQVLEFVVRRLDTPVGVLLSRRGSGDADAPLSLDRALPPGAVERVVVAPLGVGALHRVLSQRLGTSFPRPLLRRLHESSGGNPFYALELARALQRHGAPVGPDEPLPVPAGLQGLVAERLHALSENAQRLLEIVAALLDRQTATIAELARDEGFDGAIDEAVAAGVLEPRGQRLAFSHPLLASGVYAEVGPERRREIHALLAVRTAGDEEHALHVAFATDHPDADVAAELYDAARRARARGATATAGRLAENSARLTPDDRQRTERSMAAATYILQAGDPARARTLLLAEVARLEPGLQRAYALSQLAWIPLDDGDLATAVRLGEQALDEAGDDRPLQMSTHLRVGALESLRGRLDAAMVHARAAERIAREVDDDGLLTLTLAAIGNVAMMRGAGVVAETRDAIAIERTLDDRAAAGVPNSRGMVLVGMTLTYAGALDEARTLLQAMWDRLTAAGNESGRAGVLFHLAEVERRAGNWEAALELSERSRNLLAQTGFDFAASAVVGVLLDAGMGRLDRARRDAAEGLERAQRRGDIQLELAHRGALGFIELCAGDARAALAWLTPATDTMMELDVAELAVHPVVHNEIDALLVVGDLARAEFVVGRVEKLAAATGRPWARMVAARGRGQLLAAAGDIEGALRSLGAAMETNPEIGEPFEFARTLMAVGVAERRAKRKRAAREALLRAAEIFAGLPAPAWEARARAEIKRLGLRTADGELTETETRIAALAAAGRTNPEIAAEVFLSRKTVEDNLTRIYRKLGVRSRIELARTYPVSTAPEKDRELTD